jgi:hypothetical protein
MDFSTNEQEEDQQVIQHTARHGTVPHVSSS